MLKWYKKNLNKMMMKNKLKSLKSGAYILCTCFLLISPGFLFNSCSSSAGEAPKTDTVVIELMKFIPEEITVNKGDTILFINKDIVAHDVTEVNKAWASPTLANGDSWKMEATKSADYFCSIHIIMKGKIIVK